MIDPAKINWFIFFGTFLYIGAGWWAWHNGDKLMLGVWWSYASANVFLIIVEYLRR